MGECLLSTEFPNSAWPEKHVPVIGLRVFQVHPLQGVGRGERVGARERIRGRERERHGETDEWVGG